MPTNWKKKVNEETLDFVLESQTKSTILSIVV